MQYTREDLTNYERLFNDWSKAKIASHEAAIGIMRDELDGKPISEERRAEVSRLSLEACRLMVETLRASPPTFTPDTSS